MLFTKVYYLLHLSCILTACAAGREIRGRYTREVKDYEVVVPKKISENGNFISYYLPHFYNIARVRRGADSGKVHYVVPINGKDKVLELLPSEEFHAPGMVIEHHDQDARNNLNSVKLRRPRKANCYYHGTVRDESLSSVAITACSGLVGSIRVGPEEYLIEPVEEDGAPTEGPKHRHLFYKSESKRELSNHSSCGTSGHFKQAFQERMEWEEKYGYQVEEAMSGMNDAENDISKDGSSERKKRWCTTCKPQKTMHCQTPYPSCLLERPLFIEMMIVVGPRLAVQEFLDEDLEQYVNTVVNIAVRHFMDASLGRPVMVKLVRVITLGFLYPDLDPHRYEADDLLQRFCDWQLHFNPKKEAHPNHHDFALYLVKFGECKNVLGLTNMASMCRPDKSCGIASAEGLLTGHIITHLLGHSLGADHDEKDKSGCCPEEPDGTCYHMGTHICARSSAFSTCSRQCIGKFADTHAAWCLKDIPTSVDMTEPTLLPGQVYNAAEQCRINFDMDTYACLVGEFCKRLYCKVNDKECASTGDPPAQGTRCGPDQWCFNGRCVHRGTRPGATNGEWGVWAPWSPCTKTCGGGIQTSQRACDAPAPSLSGRLCPGAYVKNRMCNIGPCIDGGKGFLDQQCKNTNVRPYHGRKHEWLYFNQQIEDLKCVVMCINERQEVAVRFPIAMDGTYCNPGTKDVCIRGACTRVGCDWVIGSKAKEDACGVCHGNGTECRIMQGFFSEENFQGKMPFLKLPIGTSMVMIRETRPSPCYFVISNSLNSSYYLNNDNPEAQSNWAGGGIFRMKGTVGIYQVKADMERIFIREPLAVPITVSLLCKDEEPSIGILYQYALPEIISTTANYTWEYLSWDKCPTPCGGAIQRSIPVCVEAQGGEVEDSYCVLQKKPQDKIRVCNPRPCDAKWWVGPWVECECFGNNGITTRMVMCAHMKEAKSSYVTLIAEEECVGLPKPHAVKPCDPKKDQAWWERKGYTRKRDLTDIIPYSEAVENYSVRDDNPDESYPHMTNVGHLFKSIDPENVHDFLYLKKIGMTRDIWERMHNDFPQRVRRRRRIPVVRVATPGTNFHEAIDRKAEERKELKYERPITARATPHPDKKQVPTMKNSRSQDRQHTTNRLVKQFQIDFGKEHRPFHDKAHTTSHPAKQLSRPMTTRGKNEAKEKGLSTPHSGWQSILMNTKTKNHSRDHATLQPAQKLGTTKTTKQARDEGHMTAHSMKQSMRMKPKNLRIGKLEIRNMKPSIVISPKDNEKGWQGLVLSKTTQAPEIISIEVSHGPVGTVTFTKIPIMQHKTSHGLCFKSLTTTRERHKIATLKRDTSFKVDEDKNAAHWTTQIITTRRKNAGIAHRCSTEVVASTAVMCGSKDLTTESDEQEVTEAHNSEVEKTNLGADGKLSDSRDKAGCKTTSCQSKTTVRSCKTTTCASKTTSSTSKKTANPSRATDRSSKATDSPTKTTDCPSKTTACQIHTTDCPPETTDSPSQTTDCPPKTTARPSKTTNAPSKSTACPKSSACPTKTTSHESTKRRTTEEQTRLTVPMVNPGDPGLTPYAEFATETAVPQSQCWKSEIKPQDDEKPCRPKEEHVHEPAEDAPELDFFNTSKVKIFVVPIKTTIRTIIQNDQEFVIMETLAKYPVADELKVVEHWGDDARKQVKMARDKASRTTPNVVVQD